jgi:hypothetical protein
LTLEPLSISGDDPCPADPASTLSRGIRVGAALLSCHVVVEEATLHEVKEIGDVVIRERKLALLNCAVEAAPL